MSRPKWFTVVAWSSGNVRIAYMFGTAGDVASAAQAEANHLNKVKDSPYWQVLEGRAKVTKETVTLQGV